MRELDTAFEVFCHANPPPVMILKEIDTESNELRVVIGEISQPPIEVGVLIGDIAHALRSALDCLVWELAFIDTNCVGKGPTGTAFPLCAQPHEFGSERIAEILTGVSEDHITLIKAAQPYNPWYGGGPHPLLLVSRLDNDDKHRVVQTGIGYGGPWSITIGRMQNCERIPGGKISGESPFGRHLRPGTVLYREPIVITGPNPEVDVQTNILLGLALKDLTPIQLSFEYALDFVRGVVETFAPACDQAVADSKWRLRESRFPTSTVPKIALDGQLIVESLRRISFKPND